MLYKIDTLLAPTTVASGFDRSDFEEPGAEAHCPACANAWPPEPAVELGTQDGVYTSVVVCPVCGHCFYHGAPKEEAITRHYRDNWMSIEGIDTSPSGPPAKPTFRLADILSDLGIPTTARVLEVGCGPGDALIGAGEKGYTNTYGVELSSVRFAQASPLLPDRVFQGGFEIAPDIASKHGGPFDAIYMNQVLEHIPEPARVFEHLTRALAPGGRIIISVPEFSEEPTITQVLFVLHLHSFTADSLKALGRRFSLETKFWTGFHQGEVVAVFRSAGSQSNTSTDDRLAAEFPGPKRDYRAQVARLRSPWKTRRSEAGKAPVTLAFRTGWPIIGPDTPQTQYTEINGAQEAVLRASRALGPRRLRRVRAAIVSILGRPIGDIGLLRYVYHSDGRDDVPRLTFGGDTIKLLVK